MMPGKQLSNRNAAVGGNADTEGCDPHRAEDIEVNESIEIHNQGEVEINDTVTGTADSLVSNPQNSSECIVLSVKQLQNFMDNVTKSLDSLNSRIQSENSKLAEQMQLANTQLAEHMQAENTRLAEQLECANKKLAEDLTEKFREENSKLREELSNKLGSEIMKVRQSMDQLRKDTEIEIVSINHNIESV